MNRFNELSHVRLIRSTCRSAVKTEEANQSNRFSSFSLKKIWTMLCLFLFTENGDDLRKYLTIEI